MAASSLQIICSVYFGNYSIKDGTSASIISSSSQYNAITSLVEVTLVSLQKGTSCNGLLDGWWRWKVAILCTAAEKKASLSMHHHSSALTWFLNGIRNYETLFKAL